jgi:hypothetical protein
MFDEDKFRMSEIQNEASIKALQEIEKLRSENGELLDK